MKRIMISMITIFILFAGLSFSVQQNQNKANAAHTAYVEQAANSNTTNNNAAKSKAEGHVTNQTSIYMQDACELKSAMQMLIRTMPNALRETKTLATSIGCGLILLLAICAAIVTGGRKSSLASILCIRLSFKDGFIRRILAIYQTDGKKRQTVCS